MANSIIQVSNISKCYEISHEGREKYTTFRDVMATKAKQIFSFPKSLSSTSYLKSKEEFWALKDVSFGIEQGDRVGIIGRNGAGKSTLLKILSRITEPSKGSIKIKGRVASLLEVGTGFHPELTGRENIYLNGAILGMSRAEIKKHFDAIVDFAETEKFLDTPVKRYSSGMYVRLAFAVAAHLEPEILIVDEVLAVGDAEFQKKCLGKMQDVSKNEGRTVLFVSHNMGMLKKLCNNAIYLKEGELVNIGNVQDIMTEYLFKSSDNQNEKNDLLIGKFNTLCDVSLFRVSNRLGLSTDEFYFREGVKIEVELQIKNHLSQIIFDITILNSFGDVVAYLYTTESYVFNPKKYKISVLLKNSLLPGEYTINFGMHRNTGQTLFALENIKRIKVLSTAVNQAFDYPFHWIHGNIQLDSEWEIGQH